MSTWQLEEDPHAGGCNLAQVTLFQVKGIASPRGAGNKTHCSTASPAELSSAMAEHFSAGSMMVSVAHHINIFLRIMSQAQKTTRGFQSQKNRGPHGILSRLHRSSSKLKHGVCWFHVEVFGWLLSQRKIQTGFDTRKSSSWVRVVTSHSRRKATCECPWNTSAETLDRHRNPLFGIDLRPEYLLPDEFDTMHLGVFQLFVHTVPRDLIICERLKAWVCWSPMQMKACGWSTS